MLDLFYNARGTESVLEYFYFILTKISFKLGLSP